MDSDQPIGNSPDQNAMIPLEAAALPGRSLEASTVIFCVLAETSLAKMERPISRLFGSDDPVDSLPVR